MSRASGPDLSGPGGAARVLSVIPVVLAVTMCVRLVDASAHISPALVYAFAAGGAGLVGVPAFFWALDHGRSRLIEFVGLGALGGMVPLSVVLVSGVLGRFVFGRSIAYVRSYLEVAAPIPLVGATPWPEFWLLLAEGVVVGVVSAGICWAAIGRRRTSHPSSA